MDSLHLIYKIASERDEFEQIYKLNYQTFVEEIPQHSRNEHLRLVDRFDHENTYIIVKKKEEVVGMISVRANRPFSLDDKIANLDDYLPEGACPCEIRLLSVKEEFRKSYVFYKMVDLLVSHCLERKYNMAIISGVERQLRLYKRIGFQPFASLIENGDARFQPMFLTKEQFESSTKAFRRMMNRKVPSGKLLNFLPGPVPVHKEVEKAFAMPPISHRSQLFLNEMKEVRYKLRLYVNANFAQVVVGTGTLANEFIAAQLTRLPGKGLILANGEFGYRLINHARRFKLDFDTLEKAWNEPIQVEEIESYLRNHRDIRWIWTVHCETSTGFLYDLPAIQDVCKEYRVELCLDACSSVGVVPVDLQDVYLAAAVSGKGLKSYPGLAILFHRDTIEPDETLPRYIDLGLYHSSDGVPFTHSSNLASALNEALNWNHTIDLPSAGRIRRYFKEQELEVFGDDTYSPGVITICLPSDLSSRELGDRLKEKNILLSYESDYLLQRNWIQAAFMGVQDPESLPYLAAMIKQEADLMIKDWQAAL
ncbi:aminotransferase class V-fold PLP-dependent enzyme [Peribacillus cavernae]|uniref:Aminotransferase class V-fold PLP-dependent enzyme n=1 Tax=Peribacillus cavernae TaxID=1674310 RepID=A0A433HPI3_9BACI|nr:aminotransferase class V-fold PLP-dependent enzyme [Peribacillus cavernae]MDQ0217321.1 aspartate aminotransferase-like enzyme [Peribacillus cavernae]RUQ30219.1 aminotransferase class V-fold PLP-dependent enzyme [Peribacillus cavernae]